MEFIIIFFWVVMSLVLAFLLLYVKMKLINVVIIMSLKSLEYLSYHSELIISALI